MAQVPPPPQAEGRNTLLSESADNSEEPGDTIKGLLSSPLTTILTSPCGTKRFLAKISIKDKASMTETKTNTANIIVVIVPLL